MRSYKLSSITDYQKKICEMFAIETFESNIDEYARRKQRNIEKIKRDIYQGKVAEFMVHNWFKDQGLLVIVDIHLHPKRIKSFNADMVTDSENIHVKSCIDGGKYPNSWMFQPYDKVVSNPNDSDVFAFVVIQNEGGYMYLVKPDQVEFKPPVLKHLRKMVVYEEDLIAKEELD